MNKTSFLLLATVVLLAAYGLFAHPILLPHGNGQSAASIAGTLPRKADVTPLKKKKSIARKMPAAPPSYVCKADPATMSRVYIVLLGLNDTNVSGAEEELRRLTANDPKTKAIWVYDYKKEDTLENISADFVEKFEKFAAENDADEFVIFGNSAGGAIASYSAHLLQTRGRIELHTLASPLRGYGLSGILAKLFLNNKTGFRKEIGEGLAPFAPAPVNMKVYHHKTVTDSVYSAECGPFTDFCDVRGVQANNLSGSIEFFYTQYDHLDLIREVKKMVTSCRN